MKIRFLLASVLLAAWPLAAEDSPIRVTAKPTEFPAGGATHVSITFTRQPADGVELPKIPGAKWHTDRVGRSNSIRIVNGRRSQSETYTLPLSADTPGELTIPPLEVRFADGTTARSAPVKLKVLASGEAPRPPPGPTGRIILPEGRKRFYVGEEIPVAFELAFPAGTRLTELAFPKPECDGPVVMPDLSGRNTRHPHFTDPVEGVRETPGGTFRTLTFRTRLRFMYSGEFTLKASEQLAAAMPDRDGSDDADDMFFDDRFAMRRARRMRIDYPARKLQLVPPPPPPAGTHPLGTAANARIETDLDSRTARVGEPVELRITIANVPEYAVLKPPTLDFPDFRVYPPEEKHLANGKRSIRYALVPLAPGERRLKTAFSLFDPATGKWRIAAADYALVVTGKAAQTEQVATPPPPNEEKTPRRLAPHTGSGTELSLPLAKRGLIRGALAFAVLALAALGIELVRRIRRSPDDAKRREVAELIRRVKSGDSIDAVLREGGLAALARGAGLAEDAPAAAIAQRVDDAELREVLNDLERNSFAPEEARHERPVSAAARRTLTKLLKRALVFAALLTALSAAAECRSAAGCYDAGAKHLAEGDLPRARLCLERAHRFAPRDARIEAALHTVEAELGVPATKTRLRDRVRPDEYLTCAGVLFGAALVVAALLRKRRRKTAFAVAWLLATLGALAAALAWSQHAGNAPYRTDRAIVTAKRLELSSLPVAEGGRLVGTLDGGIPVVIVEERGEFARVRRGAQDGWCRKADVARVFPKR